LPQSLLLPPFWGERTHREKKGGEEPRVANEKNRLSTKQSSCARGVRHGRVNTQSSKERKKTSFCLH